MRIKVALNDRRLVIPVGPLGDPVARLLDDISHRFARLLGEPVVVKQLRTADNYDIDPTDAIGAVLMEGDEVVAIDLQGWVNEFLAGANVEVWTQVRQADFEQEGTDRWAKVGLDTKRNRLYIELGTGPHTLKLEIIDTGFLTNMPPALGDRVMIDMVQGRKGPLGWHAAACFVRAQPDDPGMEFAAHVGAIELQVQALSDPEPQIKAVYIDYIENEDLGTVTLEKGDVELIQSSHPKPSPDTVFIAPASEQHGDALPNPDTYPKPVDLEKHPVRSEGDTKIAMEQAGPVFAEQYWDSPKGPRQLLSVEIRLTNTDASARAAIVHLRGEYKHPETGDWIPAEVRSGNKESDYFYSCRDKHDRIIDLAEGEVTKRAFQIDIPIDATRHHSPKDFRLRRIHGPSFLKKDTDALTLRYVITDKHGKKSAILVDALQAPPECHTLEQYQVANPSQSIFAWIQCDDVDTGERFAMPIVKIPAKEGEEDACISLQFKMPDDAFRREITRTNLRRWAWEASQGEVDVLELEEWDWKRGGWEANVAAVVDLDDHVVYSVMFTVRSATGETVECISIPSEMW